MKYLNLFSSKPNNERAKTLRPETLGKIIRRTLSAVFIAGAVGLFANEADAATFTVTNVNDSGAGSLRQAVLDANAAAGADNIEFNFASGQTIILTSGELVVTQTLTVTGSQTIPISISGNATSRIFRVSSAAATLNLSFLNLLRGRAFSQNASGNGGAINSDGPLTIQNCAILSNSADGLGGAIYHTDTLSMTRSTIWDNSAGGSGGAIANEFTGSNGLVADSTIAYNNSGNQGGGIASNAQAFYSIRNSIISDNVAAIAGPNATGSINSQGYNLIGNTAGFTITGSTTGNILNVSAQLPNAVALNNGSTLTIALPANSPAIDAGDPTRAIVPDQRLTLRGSDGNSDGVRGNDIGAYERIKSTFDFNGNEASDLSVIRTVSNNSLTDLAPAGTQQPIDWYAQTSNSSFSRIRFGFDTDLPVPADYDGDGKTDPAVFRPSTGTWLIQGSQNDLYGYRWGVSTDVPVPADYDGDGKTDVAVFRAGVWYILGTQSGFTGVVNHGQPADKPVPADYDGDGKADVAVYTGTFWNIIRSTSGLTSHNFGLAGDIPVQADYDGDGKANLAVFRPSNGTWYYARNTGVPAQNFETQPFGLATDKLVPGDYDADGKTDIAVFRAGVWYILGTRKGLIISTFGLSSDDPIPSLVIP